MNLLQSLHVAIDVASALCYLHDHCEPKIIHCDIKPSNILLDDDMVARLGDFGLARLISMPTDSFQNQSSTKGIKGTTGYAAPDVDTGNIFTWKERLQIAVDAAQGLDYLHNGCKPPIIHRDIKTSNILLTEKKQAKICDFGVSRLLSTETATHTMTDHVRGTRGYFDPEYYTTGKLNKKSDIYSFGIVLLELITGRTAIITDVEPEPIHICRWVRPMFQRRDIESILDLRIQAGTYNVSSAWKAVEIAMECVSSTAADRPDINVVYKELKECLEIDVPPEIAKVPEVDESDDCSTSSSVYVHKTSYTESEIFSVHMKSPIESETEKHTC